MRRLRSVSLAVAALVTTCSGYAPIDAARGRRATETTTVYVDPHFGYQIAHPTSWTLKRGVPKYLNALKSLTPTGVVLQASDKNAFLMAVAGPGSRKPAQLRTLEHDALTHMVQTYPFGIKDSSLTIHGVRYQFASTIGSWYDYGNHIASADILALSVSRRSDTYVFLTLVKLRTPTTSSETARTANNPHGESHGALIDAHVAPACGLPSLC